MFVTMTKTPIFKDTTSPLLIRGNATPELVLKLRKKSLTLFQTSPSLTRMVGAGTLHSLLWTYIRLRNSRKKAFRNITSDSDGDLTVSLKMVIAW